MFLLGWVVSGEYVEMLVGEQPAVLGAVFCGAIGIFIQHDLLFGVQVLKLPLAEMQIPDKDLALLFQSIGFLKCCLADLLESSFSQSTKLTSFLLVG